jgi:hypothetical protein
MTRAEIARFDAELSQTGASYEAETRASIRALAGTDSASGAATTEDLAKRSHQPYSPWPAHGCHMVLII